MAGLVFEFILFFVLLLWFTICSTRAFTSEVSFFFDRNFRFTLWQLALIMAQLFLSFVVIFRTHRNLLRILIDDVTLTFNHFQLWLFSCRPFIRTLILFWFSPFFFGDNFSRFIIIDFRQTFNFCYSFSSSFHLIGFQLLFSLFLHAAEDDDWCRNDQNNCENQRQNHNNLSPSRLRPKISKKVRLSRFFWWWYFQIRICA